MRFSPLSVLFSTALNSVPGSVLAQEIEEILSEAKSYLAILCTFLFGATAQSIAAVAAAAIASIPLSLSLTRSLFKTKQQARAFIFAAFYQLSDSNSQNF